jgi:hypothetical protein
VATERESVVPGSPRDMIQRAGKKCTCKPRRDLYNIE